MNKKQALEIIDEALKEILNESFDWCKSENGKLSASGVIINKQAQEIRTVWERYLKGAYKD